MSPQMKMGSLAQFTLAMHPNASVICATRGLVFVWTS